MDLLKETEQKMSAALNHLKEELRSLRTGRASSSLVEKVMIDVYGSQMRILDLATVTASDARQLVIAPYDRSNVNAIAKGVEAANLNVRIIADGNVVRVMVPEMDESVRKEMVKVAKRKGEETKVAIRNARRDSNENLKKQKGEISEDQAKRDEKRIQDLTDKYCKQADELTQSKEQEILTI